MSNSDGIGPSGPRTREPTAVDRGAQDAARHSAQYARSLIEASLDPLVTIDVDGTIMDVNSATEKVTGVARDRLIGSDFSLYFTEPGVARTGYQQAFSLGSVTDYPLAIRHVRGSVTEVLYNATVYRDDRGRIAGVFAAARDVTARREVERELARQRERLHLVLGSSRLGMWDWNIQTGEAVLDERWAEILGYTLQELQPISSETWTRLSHPDELAVEDLLTQRHIQGRDPYYDIQMRMRHRDGRWIWLRDRGKIVEWTPNGQPLRMTETLEDIDEAHETADKLAAAEEQFRLAMDSSAIGMCLVSGDGSFLRVNPTLCHMLGRDDAELRACTWQELTHSEDLETDLALVQDVLEGRRDHYQLLKRYVAADGHIIWCDLSVAAVRNADGSVRYFVSQIVNVSERVNAQQALAEREELLRVVLDRSPDATVRFDRDLRVEFVNRTMVELSGLTAEQWLGRTFTEVGYLTENAANWSLHGQRVLETGEAAVFEYATESADGHRWSEASLAPEFAPDGSVAHVVMTSRDISARRLAEQELRALATHDPLTGLANRAALGDEIDRALRASRRTGLSTAVLMIDLDRFKNVNDSLGHGAGDELLQAAARRLDSTVRGGDLVARAGGDEFVIVMRGLDDPADAVRTAWRIVGDFRAPFPVHGGDLFATASVGVSIAGQTSTAHDLMREADTAMYVAKTEGRDRATVFNEELRIAVTSRLTIEGDLRRALDRNEFAVWYQPEISLTTGRVIAVEALLRWHHPGGETYIADRFISIAEETGLILDIGDWVLRETCAQAAAWAAARPDHQLTVRVNVSALQLVEGGLLTALDDALASSGLDPALLCVEITETALLRETTTVRDNLAGIRARGIRIAVDDFGTGYASLAYLRQYPIDVLKIDRSFVGNVTTDDQARKLVAGIVALADALGITVTAEGVESEAQATILRQLRCPGAQGFLYSPAVHADQITALLDTTFPHG